MKVYPNPDVNDMTLSWRTFEVECMECRKPLRVKGADEGLLFWGNPDETLRRVVCNTCGDWRHDLWEIEDKIMVLTWLLIGGHLQASNDKVRGKMRELLVGYMEHVCKRCGIAKEWSEEFLETVLENPGKVVKLLARFKGNAWEKRTTLRF